MRKSIQNCERVSNEGKIMIVKNHIMVHASGSAIDEDQWHDSRVPLYAERKLHTSYKLAALHLYCKLFFIVYSG